MMDTASLVTQSGTKYRIVNSLGRYEYPIAEARQWLLADWPQGCDQPAVVP